MGLLGDATTSSTTRQSVTGKEDPSDGQEPGVGSGRPRRRKCPEARLECVRVDRSPREASGPGGGAPCPGEAETCGEPVGALVGEPERLWRRSEELVHFGCWVLDQAADRLSWSEGVYRIFGLKPDEFAGTYEAFLEAIHPEDRSAVDDAYTRSLREGKVTYEVEHRIVRRHTGEVRVVHEKCFNQRDVARGNIRSVGVVQDITERKRAEQALRLFKDAVENATDAIGMSTPDGRHYYQNRAFHRLLGDIGEDPLATLYVDRQVGEEVFRTIMTGGQWIGEVRMYAADRRILDIFLRAYANRDENGNLVSLVGIHNDITAQKRTEEALRAAHGELQQTHDQLERRVKERTADLAAANTQLRHERKTLEHLLRASDHERRLIAYDIHDGLAQELAAAIMHLQFYQQQKEVLPREARQAFDSGLTLLERGHREARRLISGVRPPILDESGVLAAVAHLAYDPAFEQGPKVELHSRVAFRRLDPVAENVVYRMVQEALSNARSYSQSPRIVVSLVQRGDCLRIAVRDWGVGFDPRKVPEDRFGLAGIRERARLLGGRCRIRSRPGGGTSVLVELPVIEPHAREPRHA